MSVTRRGGIAALLALAACSSGGGEEPVGPVAPTPQPASLSITIPSLEAAIPGCAAPFVRLENAGADVGCGVGCPTASQTCTLTCPDYLGLLSATRYPLAVVYLQSSTPVASAALGEVSLLAGANQLSVAAATVTPLDANHDGTSDLQSLCP